MSAGNRNFITLNLLHMNFCVLVLLKNISKYFTLQTCWVQSAKINENMEVALWKMDLRLKFKQCSEIESTPWDLHPLKCNFQEIFLKLWYLRCNWRFYDNLLLIYLSNYRKQRPNSNHTFLIVWLVIKQPLTVIKKSYCHQ